MKFLPTLGGQMSGSLGGLTASHNRGGQYLRRRSVPVNPSTARQELVRAALATLNQAWGSELTQTQRDGWTLYGDNVPTTDRLGQVLVLTGQQQFIRSNVPRLQADLEPVYEPPVIFDTGEPPVELENLAIADTFDNVQFSAEAGTPPSDNGQLLVYFGRPQGAGRGFYKGPYQLAFTQPVTIGVESLNVATDPDNFTTEYLPSEETVGLFFPIRLRISYGDGRLSAALAAMLELIELPPP